MRAFHRVLVVLFGLWGTCASAASYDEELRKAAEAIQTVVAQQELRSIAVADFTDLQGQAGDVGRLLAEELSSNLVALGKDIVVIDRSALMYSLRKRNWKTEDLDDPEKLRMIASQLKLGVVAKGTVIPLGSRLRLNINLINARSAAIITSVASEIPLTESLASFSGNGKKMRGTPSNTTAMAQPNTAERYDFIPKSVNDERSGKLEFVRMEDEGQFSITTLKFTAFGRTAGQGGVQIALQRPAQNTYLVDSEGRQYYAVGARHIGVIDKDEGGLPLDTKKGEIDSKLFAFNVPTMFQIVTPRFSQQSDEASIVVTLARGWDSGRVIRWSSPTIFSIRTEKAETSDSSSE